MLFYIMQFYVDKRHMRHLRIVSSTFCEAGLIKSLQSRQGVFKSFFLYLPKSRIFHAWLPMAHTVVFGNFNLRTNRRTC